MSNDNSRHTLEPFKIAVSQAVLDDLARRLRATRWAPDWNNEDELYGMSTAYLRPLAEYWADGFDWRTVEAELDIFAHYRVEIDRAPIHFLREPGRGPAPIPIILLHGWPWTFWDWSKVVRPLADPASFGGDPADAFDVVVVSLPGFGFSTPLKQADLTFVGMADRFHTLMTEVLGYPKYAAAGSDYGALISGQLGHKYAAHLYGIFLGHDLVLTLMQGERPWELPASMIPPGASPELRASVVRFMRTYASHRAVHQLEPQTLALGLNDSPVGMLAWLLQRWKKWSDPKADFEKVFPPDHILTNATIYWVNQAFGSSVRIYQNTNRYPWTPSHDRTPLIEAPAGFNFLLGDTYPPGVKTPEERIAFFENGPTRPWYNPVHVAAHEQGGHFGPWENPQSFIDGIRTTFQGLR